MAALAGFIALGLSLLLWQVSPAVAVPAPTTDAVLTCNEYARQTPFSEVLVRPRPLPKPHEPLVAHRWTRKASERFFAIGHRRFQRGLVRYQVIGGKVYVDTEAQTKGVHFADYRKPFDEMLVFAAWLYALPDMDIVLNTLDNPISVHKFPVLSWAYDSSIGDGFSLPHHKHWDEFGFGTDQLQRYMSCLDKRYPWSNKLPKVFWRGSPTGVVRGWEKPAWNPQLRGPAHAWGVFNFTERLLSNKRTYVVMASRPYSFMDVGLIPLHTDTIRNYGSRPGSPDVEFFQRYYSKPRVSKETWSEYAVLLSLGGHGFTDRIPAQLMSNSLVLMMNSTQREWFADFFVDKKHLFLFQSDASDYVHLAKQLTQHFFSRQAQYQAIVANARATALQRFNLLAVMDAFVWALVNASSYCHWKPRRAPGFDLLKPEMLSNRNLPASLWSQVMAHTTG